MKSEFSQQRMEEIKDSLCNVIDLLKEDLTEEYLNDHCIKVSEEMFGYDGCSRTIRVFTDQNISEASQEAKKAIGLALRDIGFSINI